MILQLFCLALIALLAVLRGPRALISPHARPVWWASVAGTLSLATYGFPVPASTYDHWLGSQNLVTLIRDGSALIAMWFLREAFAGYRRSTTTRYGSRRLLLGSLAADTVLFFSIEHRIPTQATLVNNQIAQPAAWLYGTVYIATMLWMLADSARLTFRNGRGGVRVITLGAAITAAGCALELAVLTATHLGLGGVAFQQKWDQASAGPFFLGLATMLSGVAYVTIAAALRRRVLTSRLRRIGRHRRLLPRGFRRRPVMLSSDRYLAADTHHLLVVLGNAERAGAFTPSPEETRVIHRARTLLRADRSFRPETVSRAA